MLCAFNPNALRHAVGIRAFVRFLHAEEYVEKQIQITMSRVEVKPMRVLSEEDLGGMLKACRRPRDKALLLLMVDTGLRRTEVLFLDWIDVDIASGVVNVRRTKNKRARSVFKEMWSIDLSRYAVKCGGCGGRSISISGTRIARPIAIPRMIPYKSSRLQM